MSTRGRVAALLACAVAILLVAWYAGTQVVAPVAVPAAGSVRLGPEPGEEVAGYLARLPAELPTDGTASLALVQLTEQLSTGAAAAVLTGASPVSPVRSVSAVLRSPVARVQTALRFEPLENGMQLGWALDNALQRARQQADADAARLAGRPGDVAAAEATVLADPECRCVLALVVQADRDALAAVAARPEVRAVHAAPPGVTARELAVAPLLPEQAERADPPPDDGGVPPRVPSRDTPG